MIITVFRSRLRSDAADNGYNELGDEMEELGSAMPGFVDFKTFQAADGERVSIATFDTLEHHNAWRDHPQHRQAKARAAQFYIEYSTTVSEQLHAHTWRPGL